MKPKAKIAGKKNNKKNEKWLRDPANMAKNFDLNIDNTDAKKHIAISSLICERRSTGNKKPVETTNKYKPLRSEENK